MTRLLDALLPEACRLCEPSADAPPWVCERCIRTSPPPPPVACAACGRDVAFEAAPHAGPLVRAATRYATDEQVPAALALRLLKYDGRRRLAPPLARLLARRVCPIPAGGLVPVPLHPARLRRRGFNQAALLTRHLGRLTGRPAIPTGLRRLRPTEAQARLARDARLVNLEDAFAASAALRGATSVVLVDDVATTGATLTACAAALRRVGVRHVHAVVVARRVLLSASVRTG